MKQPRTVCFSTAKPKLQATVYPHPTMSHALPPPHTLPASLRSLRPGHAGGAHEHAAHSQNEAEGPQHPVTSGRLLGWVISGTVHRRSPLIPRSPSHAGLCPYTRRSTGHWRLPATAPWARERAAFASVPPQSCAAPSRSLCPLYFPTFGCQRRTCEHWSSGGKPG